MTTTTAERLVRLDRLEREFDRPHISPTAIFATVLGLGLLVFVFLEAYVMSTMFASVGSW
jgi:hypothetical protein